MGATGKTVAPGATNGTLRQTDGGGVHPPMTTDRTGSSGVGELGETKVKLLRVGA
jgi:hypothetical protein